MELFENAAHHPPPQYSNLSLTDLQATFLRWYLVIKIEKEKYEQISIECKKPR